MQITESKLDSLNEKPKLKKKVFNILVECLQNLYHHLDEYPTEGDGGRYAIFLIGKKEDYYTIMTGNYILNDKSEKLTKYLDKINSLSKEELKTLYKEVLSNDKGGGGLGFIDMIRRSEHKIEYNLKKIDNKYSFISFTVNISQND